MDIREKKKSLESKSKIPRALKANISRNERNEVKKYREKIGYKITNNSRGVILLDNKIVTTFGMMKLPRK